MRAFIAQPVAADSPAPAALRPPSGLRATIAVLNFAVDSLDAAQQTWGALLADELTRMLSQQSLCGVVSRLSAPTLGPTPDWHDLARHLGARCVVGGRCSPGRHGSRVTYRLRLAGTGTVLEDSFNLRLADIGDVHSEPINRWIGRISAAVIGTELRRAGGLQLPALADFTLLFAGVSMMHKTSAQFVQQASTSLSLLCERHPRVAEPRAWLAKLQVLRIPNGVSVNAAAEAQQAHAHIRHALSDEPAHSLALTISGLVHLFLDHDLNAARKCCEQALQLNCNESLAWLFLSSVHAHGGDGTAAMQCIHQSRSLSPADPLAHYFDGFTAWALLFAQRYDEALWYARRALSAHSSHRPSYFTLAMAQQLAGDNVGARQTAVQWLWSAPYFPAQKRFKGFLAGANTRAQKLTHAPRKAGLPN